MLQSPEDKIKAIQILDAVQQNLHSAERIFNESHPDQSVCRKYSENNKFNETGNSDAKK